MVLVIVILIAGFILSALLHFCMLFQIYDPPRELLIFINMGAFFAIYAAMFISRRTCDIANSKDFRKILAKICPKWLSVLTGLLIIYTLVGFAIVIFKKYLGDSISTNEGGNGVNFQGFSGWMAIYSLAFSIIYSCKIYVKNKDM